MPKKKEEKKEDKEVIKDATEYKKDTIEEIDEGNGEVNIKVGDIMTVNVISAKPDDTIEHIAKLMNKYKIEAVIILGRNRYKNKQGIITSKDIVYKVVAKGKDVKTTLAKDVMRGGLITIGPENTIDEAAKLMRKYDIRRLPVVNEKNEIIGIITESDIVRISPELHVLISERARIRDYTV